VCREKKEKVSDQTMIIIFFHIFSATVAVPNTASSRSSILVVKHIFSETSNWVLKGEADTPLRSQDGKVRQGTEGTLCGSRLGASAVHPEAATQGRQGVVALHLGRHHTAGSSKWVERGG
jgi:hypothetical protein